jgi:hypothetical protein
MPKPSEYLVIQAWAEMICTASSFIVADQEKAAAANAPIDSIYCTNKRWVSFSEITNPDARRRIEERLIELRNNLKAWAIPNVTRSPMQTEASYFCDSCGEEIVIPLDLTAGESQKYVEDCPVCCRPNVIHVEVEENGEVRVRAEKEWRTLSAISAFSSLCTCKRDIRRYRSTMEKTRAVR